MPRERRKEIVLAVLSSAMSSNKAPKDEAYLLNRKLSKPHEPEHKMTITPLKVILQCLAKKKPVWSGVRVTNPTKEKQSYQEYSELLQFLKGQAQEETKEF